MAGSLRHASESKRSKRPQKFHTLQHRRTLRPAWSRHRSARSATRRRHGCRPHLGRPKARPFLSSTKLTSGISALGQAPPRPPRCAPYCVADDGLDTGDSPNKDVSLDPFRMYRLDHVRVECVSDSLRIIGQIVGSGMNHAGIRKLTDTFYAKPLGCRGLQFHKPKVGSCIDRIPTAEPDPLAADAEASPLPFEAVQGAGGGGGETVCCRRDLLAACPEVGVGCRCRGSSLAIRFPSASVRSSRPGSSSGLLSVWAPDMSKWVKVEPLAATIGPSLHDLCNPCDLQDTLSTSSMRISASRILAIPRSDLKAIQHSQCLDMPVSTPFPEGWRLVTAHGWALAERSADGRCPYLSGEWGSFYASGRWCVILFRHPLPGISKGSLPGEGGKRQPVRCRAGCWAELFVAKHRLPPARYPCKNYWRGDRTGRIDPKPNPRIPTSRVRPPPRPPKDYAGVCSSAESRAPPCDVNRRREWAARCGAQFPCAQREALAEWRRGWEDRPRAPSINPGRT